MGVIYLGGSGQPTAALTSISYSPKTAPLTQVTYG